MSEKKHKTNVKLIIQVTAIVILAGLLMYGLGRSSVSNNKESMTIQSVAASEIIPSGIPKVYGEELGISYDDVSSNNPSLADLTIGVLKNLDKKIVLEGAELQRYISITSKISCEYCCGSKSVIFSDGQPACGCAHSYAMRGLAKYLIKNHGTEFSDDEILEELGKWKVLFYPGIHEGKATALKSNGIELNYINLASNKYRGIEQGKTSGGMVGGC